MNKINKVHIFKAGLVTDSQNQTENYTIEDLQKMADSYDISLHEAPVIWGHKADHAWGRPLNSSSQLANGWIKKLYIQDDNLYGDLEVDDETLKAIKNGSLKKRSAGFYGPDSKHNPVNNSWYLRHLALLGSEPPAIKGLKDIAIFSEEPFVYNYNETNINNSMEREEAIAALNENAADWIAVLLKNDGEGFGEVITEMIPQPSEENNWLWNEENQAYEGQLKTDKDDLFDFKISKEEDGSWISLTTLANAEAEAETDVEEYTEDTESEDEVEMTKPELPTEEKAEMSEDCGCTKNSEDTDELKELREFKEKAEAELAKLQSIVAEKLEKEKEAKYSEVINFCDSIYSEGRVSESVLSKASLISLMKVLLGDNQPLMYSEGDKSYSAFDTISVLLKNIPQKVEFSEATTRELNTPVITPTVPKYLGTVTPESEKEYTEIKQYMEKKGLSNFREARRAYLSK